MSKLCLLAVTMTQAIVVGSFCALVQQELGFFVALLLFMWNFDRLS